MSCSPITETIGWLVFLPTTEAVGLYYTTNLQPTALVVGALIPIEPTALVVGALIPIEPTALAVGARN
jgi:hypothetical protein